MTDKSQWKVLERLKAYEDTGLTPEDCAEYKKFEDTANSKTIGRLVELFDADKEGRVVVLPCKVGDTVWAILDGEKHARECMAEFVNIGSFSTVVVLSERDWLRAQYGVTAAAFGKTVFLTREEAEEAVRRAENG